MTFEPVRTKADLNSLDDDEIVAGYLETKRGDPEPGPNRGRAYWHGWRCAMMDYGDIEIDADHRYYHQCISTERSLAVQFFFFVEAQRKGSL